MNRQYKNNYKRRFYNQKIRGIYATAYALIATIVFLIAAILGTGEWMILEAGYAMCIGTMAVILLVAVVSANRIRLKRFNDDIVGDRILSPDDEFWTKRSNESIVALVLMEVGLFVLVYQCAVTDGLGLPSVLILVALMIGVFITKMWYNRKLKELSYDQYELRSDSKEKPVYFGREMFFEVAFAIIIAVMTIVVFVFLGERQGGPTQEEVGAFVIALIVLVITLIVRLRSLSVMRDENDLQEWLEKERKKKEAAEAAEREREAQRAAAAAARVQQPEEESEPPEEPQNVFSYATLSSGEKVEYADSESFAALSKDFQDFATQNGIHLSFDECRDIFAAMAASRAVWLRSENENFTYCVAVLLCDYFTGNREVLKVRMGAQNAQDLVQSPMTQSVYETSTLFDRLKRAKELTNSVNILVVQNAETERYDEVFKPLIKSFRAPEDENRLKVDFTGSLRFEEIVKDSCIILPTNLWCVFVGSADGALTGEMGQYASEVKLHCVESSEEDVGLSVSRFTFLSFARFTELLNESLSKHFLSLDVWKKFDKIEEYLQAQIPFEISNPLARQIEQYTSVQLACGAEVGEIIDAVIVSRLFPLLDGYTKEQIDQEGNTFIELLDGLFGMDNLPLTQKALSDRNLV